jgi:hypothetical protein
MLQVLADIPITHEPSAAAPREDAIILPPSNYTADSPISASEQEHTQTCTAEDSSSADSDTESEIAFIGVAVPDDNQWLAWTNHSKDSDVSESRAGDLQASPKIIIEPETETTSILNSLQKGVFALLRLRFQIIMLLT